MKISKHCLPNGLRLVYHEDTSMQMVTLNIVYDVSVRDEHLEHTGFAHSLEHLMFSGLAHIPDYDTPLQLAEGENNAWTDSDTTNYYLTVPKTNVETAFWLESDRILELTFSGQGLEVQRGVVTKKFKQRCLSQPYDGIGHLSRPLASRAHPYHWPVISKELSHIGQTTLDEVKPFSYRFHAPNSAVLAVTGNISWGETVRLTEKWFGLVPRRDVPVWRLPQEPEQMEKRRLTVGRNVSLDALLMGYHVCDHRGVDYCTFDILSDILNSGHSNRLSRRLAQEQSTFSGIDAHISGTRDTGLLQISSKSAAGVSLEQAGAVIRRELEELRQSPTDAQGLGKVKNKSKSTQIFGNINYLNVVINPTWLELMGKAEDIDLEVERYHSVIAEQLHTVMQRVSCENNAAVLYHKSDK